MRKLILLMARLRWRIFFFFWIYLFVYCVYPICLSLIFFSSLEPRIIDYIEFEIEIKTNRKKWRKQNIFFIVEICVCLHLTPVKIGWIDKLTIGRKEENLDYIGRNRSMRKKFDLNMSRKLIQSSRWERDYIHTKNHRINEPKINMLIDIWSNRLIDWLIDRSDQWFWVNVELWINFVLDLWSFFLLV